MKFGYVRSIALQPAPQEQARMLFEMGIEQVYTEPDDGPTRLERRDEMLSAVGEGDTVVAASLPVLVRDLDDLGDVVSRLDARRAGLMTLIDGIDMDTEQGRMLSAVLRSMLELPQ